VAVAAPDCQSWGVGAKGGQRFLKGGRGLGDGREFPSGVQGRSPSRGSGGRSAPEAEAFCLNRYKILTVHGRESNELDFMHSDSISLC